MPTPEDLLTDSRTRHPGGMDERETEGLVDRIASVMGCYLPVAREWLRERGVQC